MKKGSITVYLSLVFMILLSFLVAILQGSKLNAMKLKIESALDLSMESALTEYNRPLLEEYGLLFIDDSYGTQYATTENLLSHMKKSFRKNIDPLYEYSDQNLLKYLANQKLTDFYKITLDDLELTQLQYATDHNGEVFRRQAIDYVKNQYALNVLEDFIAENKGNFDLINSKGWFKEESQNEKDLEENLGIIENGYKPSENAYDEDGNIIYSSEEVYEISADPDCGKDLPAVPDRNLILNMVVGENTLSTASASLDQVISHREKSTLNTGNMELNDQSTLESAENKLLFIKYILEKAGTFTSSKEDHALTYEVEYVLAGKQKDSENLKWVVNRILAIRECANLIYLIADAEKQELIFTTSEALVGWIPAVGQVVVPIMQGIINAGWAYMEGIQDVKTLLNGGKVPILKTRATWKTDLDSIFGAAIGLETNGTSGLTYEQYLIAFLLLENEETKVFRMMDLVEMNMRRKEGQEYFRMDACISKFVVKAEVSGSDGRKFSLVRSRYYDTGSKE